MLPVSLAVLAAWGLPGCGAPPSGDDDGANDTQSGGDGDVGETGDGDASTSGTGDGDDTGDGDGDGDGDGTGDGDGDGEAVCGNGTLEPGEYCDPGIFGACVDCYITDVGPLVTFVPATDSEGYVLADWAPMDALPGDDLLLSRPVTDGLEFAMVSGADLPIWPDGTVVDPDSLAGVATPIMELATQPTSLTRTHLGDLDGDGLGDWAIHFRSDNETPGTLRLYLGASLLQARADGVVLTLDDADVVLRGENAGDYAGATVDIPGDLDGDGVNDLLVAARGFDVTPEPPTGKVYLVSGAAVLALPKGSDVVLDTVASRTFLGTAEQWHANDRFASVGDLDGDGLGDVAFQNFILDTVLVFLSSSVAADPEGTEYTLTDANYVLDGSVDPSFTDDFGGVIRGRADFDGDGRADLVVTDRLSAIGGSGGLAQLGQVMVVLSSTLMDLPEGSTLPMTEADYRIAGEEPLNVKFGETVQVDFDMDDDGIPDMAIGSSFASELLLAQGKVFLIPGAALADAPRGTTLYVDEVGVTLYGDEEAQLFGDRMYPSIDLEGDGQRELMMRNKAFPNEGMAVEAQHMVRMPD